MRNRKLTVVKEQPLATRHFTVDKSPDSQANINGVLPLLKLNSNSNCLMNMYFSLHCHFYSSSRWRQYQSNNLTRLATPKDNIWNQLTNETTPFLARIQNEAKEVVVLQTPYLCTDCERKRSMTMKILNNRKITPLACQHYWCFTVLICMNIYIYVYMIYNKFNYYVIS